MLYSTPIIPRALVMKGPTEAQRDARERVIWLHREAGIAIAELARRMSTSPALVSNWVNEHRYPSPMSCERIERVWQDRGKD